MTPSDADIPDSIARAPLNALQEKRTGNQLPATMISLARVRASQLQQCLAMGTIRFISLGQGPSGSINLADKVPTVNRTLECTSNQPSIAVPAQINGSRRGLTPTADTETPGSLYTAIANSGNICLQLTRDSISGYKHSQHQHQVTSFRMSASDIPEQLVLRGTSDEDVPAILTQFRKRVHPKSDLHVPSEGINKQTVRFLPLLLKSVALETYSQLTRGTLEWRSDNTLAELRVLQIDVTPVASQTWSDWVEALTVMFVPPNLLSNLRRQIATIKQGGTEHPGESVDQSALRISSLFTRLLAES